MLIKLGVSIEKLNRPVRRKLNIIENVFKSLGEIEAVITATFEGNHSPASLHYNHNAVDIRLPIDKNKTQAIYIKLKDRLGDDFDVILHTNSHFHIELDP